ncbi:MAG: hypothetical protein PHQ41_04250 [Candidatus Cloacimonetes bacterium]|nr:hypothetical protein [Candidatus Cloacimonadota bacterium]
MNIALYASNHGYGHASRVAAIAASLIEYGIHVYICTNRPRFLFQDLPDEGWSYRETSLDVGVVHKEHLVSDIPATKTAIMDLFSKREELVGNEILFLREHKIDLVIADIPYLVVEACLYAEVPVIGVSNFDWYYIYKELFKDDEEMVPLLNTIWALYRRMNATYLPMLGNFSSVPGFRDPVPIQLLARTKDEFPDLRSKYEIPENTKILLIMFGGEGQISIPLEKICQAWEGMVLCPFKGQPASNLIAVNPDEDFLALVKMADLVICKPGYSTFAEIMSQGKAMLYIPRQNYPEETVLIDGAKNYSGAKLIQQFPAEVGEIRALLDTVCKTQPHPVETSNTSFSGMILNDYLRVCHPGDKILSVFDLGSNNMNYVLYNKSRNVVIHRFWVSTALGMYLQNNVITQEGIEAVLSSIAKLMERDSYIESEKYLIATGVFRQASNAQELLAKIEDQWHIPTKIISAKTEMKYAWWAAKEYMNGAYDYLVMDIGGASTELSWKSPRGFQTGISFDFGLLSLYREEVDYADRYTDVAECFSSLPEFTQPRLIVNGLTATVLVKYILNISLQQSLLTSGTTFSRENLVELQERLTSDFIKQPGGNGLNKREIITIQIAARIVQQMLDRYRISDFVVINDGISIGYAKWKR